MNRSPIIISARSEVGLEDLLCLFIDGAVVASGGFHKRIVGLRRQVRKMHLFTI